MDFNSTFNNTITQLINKIEAVDQQGIIELLESEEGVLKIICENPTRIFIINRQSSLQELWLSSPVSGAYHFFLKENNWITIKGEKLESILYTDLKSLTNLDFKI